MCVGIPMQVLSVDGIAATCTDGSRHELVDLSLTGPVPVGGWVLNFLGAARSVLDETEARQIRAALSGLNALMAGGDLGNAFADLEARPPSLPPHLEAARAAGKTQA